MTDPGRKLRTLVNFQKANMDIQAEKLTEYEHRIAQLMAERDVLANRVKALEADAGRYRWLKPRLLGADFDWNEEGNCVLVFEMPNDATVSANCDETIDAAIKGATTKEHGNAICFEPMGK